MFHQSVPRPARVWTRSDVKSWLAKGDLSSALSLSPLHTLSVPIFVNILAVGLEGGGNQGVAIDPVLLEQWLQHLDHVVHHTVLQSNSTGSGSTSPSDREAELLRSARRAFARAREGITGKDKSKEVEADSASPTAQPARIHYRYHIRLIHVSTRIIEVVERYLAVHYRVENKEHTIFQVDGDIMDGVLEGLIKHLHLDDAYNLFVLNPSTRWLVVPKDVAAANPEIVYGYRSGFSNEELDQMLDTKDDPIVKKFTDEWPQKPEALYTDQMKKDAEKQQPIPQFTPRPEEHAKNPLPTPPQLSVVDYVDVSEQWAASVLAAPHFTGPQPLSQYLHQQQQYHPQVLRANINNQFALEDCLVDNWVGKGRTSFVDLSAGPFKWGPIIGGEGVRTNASFPSIKTFVSQLQRERAEEVNEDTYVDAAYDAEAVQAERVILTDIWHNKQCGPLGSLELGTQHEEEECRSIAYKLIDLDEWEKEHDHRIVDTTVAEHSDALKAKAKPPPIDALEGMSFFHDDSLADGKYGEGSHAAAGHDASIEMDHFLAHLSSTLSNALHHVITPTVADTDVSHGYAEQVNFQLYVLVNHELFDPLDNQLFNKLKFGIEQLKLPSQTFTYTSMKLMMDDDPALAMAYTNSLRTTVVPSMLFDGRFSAIKRFYIDTAILSAQVKGLNLREKAEKDRVFGEANRVNIAKNEEENKNIHHKFPNTASRDVPIFLFSIDFPLPVLVDKFFQAQAVPHSNMIVAVQSNLNLWESPLVCNDRPMFWNLRDPMRAILASTAHVLGGLLPVHTKYSLAHGRSAQDWMWATGTSPLAHTSAQGLEFSQMQKDTLHRNYVLTAWTTASKLVNEHILLLSKQKTSMANRQLGGIDDEIPVTSTFNGTNPTGEVVGKYSAKRLSIQNAYSSFTDIITLEMNPAMEEFHFDAACAAIPRLYQRANEFAQLVRGLIEWNNRDRCHASTLSAPTATTSSSRGWGLHLTYHWYLLTAIACVGIVLYRILVQRDDKPKLN